MWWYTLVTPALWAEPEAGITVQPGLHSNALFPKTANKTKSKQTKKNPYSWGCSSVVECLPSMCKTLGFDLQH
jgi:hypothetical protein